MKLTDQALGAVMMALQESLLEQTDIVPVLKEMNFQVTGPSQSELVITNPPVVNLADTILADVGTPEE